MTNFERLSITESHVQLRNIDIWESFSNHGNGEYILLLNFFMS